MTSPEHRARAQGLTQPEVEAFGVALGQALRPGHVVLLHGPMGAGKTTLTRAVGRGLGVDRPDRVRSPTFNICLVHAGPIPLYHVDLFRLAPDDGDTAPSAAFGALGLEALMDRIDADADGVAGSVVLIEWAELWGSSPIDALVVTLAHASPTRRDLEARATAGRHAPLVEILNSVTKPLIGAS